MLARLQPLCISRYAAPFAVPVAMFVDAARPHPGCSWRASVLTGLAKDFGSGADEPTLGPGPRTVFLRSGAVPSGVTWHVAAKMA